MAHKCGFRVGKSQTCDVETNDRAVARLGRTEYSVFLCRLHQRAGKKVLVELGMTPVGSRSSDRKPRKLYDARSGERFTTADVRRWLGTPSTQSGRVSQEQINQYAATH